ncbi:MAG: ribosomal-protein-alanine N-acetyltransferase [Limisphaerales bacterium]
MKFLLDGYGSQRLNFRLLEDADFEQWKTLFEAKDAARFLAMDTSLSPEQLCKDWFTRVYSRYKKDLGGMNVLVDKDSGKIIGQCGLLVQTVEEESRLEIAYSILPRYWSQGYASEAAIRVKELAFEKEYSDNIISLVHPENIASEKVAIKNGMTLEKHVASFHGIPINVFGIDKAV